MSIFWFLNVTSVCYIPCACHLFACRSSDTRSWSDRYGMRFVSALTHSGLSNGGGSWRKRKKKGKKRENLLNVYRSLQDPAVCGSSCKRAPRTGAAPVERDRKQGWLSPIRLPHRKRHPKICATTPLRSLRSRSALQKTSIAHNQNHHVSRGHFH